MLGPGLLAGLSDDDPAGITTYSILGAEYGYRLLWVVVLSTALLVIFHLLAVRLGTVTGQGFAAVIRRVYGTPWALAFAALFLVANSGTICAEFAGIAAAASLARVPAWAAAVPAAVVLCVLMIDASFRRIEHILVAISCLLASYVAAGALAHPDWGAAARGSVLPTGSYATAGVMVAITATLGTTLAPWGLAFIQSYASDKGLRWPDYRLERIDVVVGSLFTGIIGVFIVVACAATLHVNGVHIRDARDAAEALRPLAGRHAATLFGLGLMGAALLAAAIVPLATAYSISEATGHAADLDTHLSGERLFYGVFVGLSIGAAVVVSIPGVNVIRLIYLSQVLNGVLLAPHLIALMLLCSSEDVVGEHRIGRPYQVLGWAGIALVVASTIALGLTAII